METTLETKEGVGETGPEIIEPPTDHRRKFHYDRGTVEIAAHLVCEFDPNGRQLRVIRNTDYAPESVRTLLPSVQDLREHCANPTKRSGS